jgi:hypothetical protein
VLGHFLTPSSVLLRVLGMTTLSLLVLWSLSGDYGAAQGLGAGAQAMTVAMGPPLKALDRAPYAALPAAGGSASDSSVQYAIEGLGLVDLPLVTANGSGSGGSASTTATAWTSAVNLFGGRVRVNSLRVNASTNSTTGSASSSGDVIIEGLVVDNVPVPVVELNQSVPLPGIGTVIAREVQVAPGGATATANGLRIVGDPASGPLAGKELIVTQASAGIPSVTLTPPTVAAAPLSSVLQPRPPLGTLVPLSGFGDNDNFSSDDDDNDNFDFNDNENFNDNGNTNTASTRTPTRGTGSSGATATATTSATRTPTRTLIP